MFYPARCERITVDQSKVLKDRLFRVFFGPPGIRIRIRGKEGRRKGAGKAKDRDEEIKCVHMKAGKLAPNKFITHILKLNCERLFLLTDL